MLSDRRYWNPYNFSRLLGYRSRLLTVVRPGSVLKQLQVAMSLLFSIFARGGIAWYYNIFIKLQNLEIDTNKRSEVFSKKPKLIKTGLQVFSWHPGSLSNHKYLAFRSKQRIKDLFNVEPSFKVNARRIDYRSNNFMRNSRFKRRFRRPFWQRRNRFWRPKRLSRVKFIDVRKVFLRKKKFFKLSDLSFRSSKNFKKVSYARMRKIHNPLKIIYRYFKTFNNFSTIYNFLISRTIGSFHFNHENEIRSIYAYSSYEKPEIVVPELNDIVKPGTPENPNILPVDNMPTGSVRRMQRKKRKLEKKLFDPFYTEVTEDFHILSDLFFSDLVYKEKRWFSYIYFLNHPIDRVFTYPGIFTRKQMMRRVMSKSSLWRGNFFKPYTNRRIYEKFKTRGYKKLETSQRAVLPRLRRKKVKNAYGRKFRRVRKTFYYRYNISDVLKYTRKLMRISCRVSRLTYRSRDCVFMDTYFRHYLVHWSERRHCYVYYHHNKKVNPYFKSRLNHLSALSLKNTPTFGLRFDYINEIKFLKRYAKIRFFKKKKIKANTLSCLPQVRKFSIKKPHSTKRFETFFNFNKSKLPFKFSKKTINRKFEKSYMTGRTPFFQKTPLTKRHNLLKKLNITTYRSKFYRKSRMPRSYFKILVKIRKRLLAKEALTYFKQFGRYKKATRLFPSILLVASLSRYALSVLNEAQCVGVSLIYFTDAAVSPLCNLFNVVMNSHIHTLASMELNVDLIFNKAKVFNLISRVW